MATTLRIFLIELLGNESPKTKLSTVDKIITELSSRLPEKKEWIPESGKLEDHWGLTEAGISRTIENNESVGFNKAIDQVRKALGLEEEKE